MHAFSGVAALIALHQVDAFSIWERSGDALECGEVSGLLAVACMRRRPLKGVTNENTFAVLYSESQRATRQVGAGRSRPSLLSCAGRSARGVK